MIKEINYFSKTDLSDAKNFLIRNIPHSKEDIIYALDILSGEVEWPDDLKSSELYGYYTSSGILAGICGLYSINEDCVFTDWVNWFAVDSDFRGQKVATEMLEFLMKKTRKKYLRVYTTLQEKVPFWKKFFSDYNFEIEDGVKYYSFQKKLTVS